MPNFYENPNLQKKANKIVTEGGQFPTRKEAIQGINNKKSFMRPKNIKIR